MKIRFETQSNENTTIPCPHCGIWHGTMETPKVDIIDYGGKTITLTFTCANGHHWKMIIRQADKSAKQNNRLTVSIDPGKGWD